MFRKWKPSKLICFYLLFAECGGTIMEAVCSLKRDRATTFENCILCQETKTDKLFNSSAQGLSTLKEAAHSRSKLRDPQNRDAVERVLGLVTADEQHLVWHRSCYASFTSKSHISRLQSLTHKTTTADAEKDAGPSRPQPSLRSSSMAINWKACMFCRDINSKLRLSSVTTLKMSNRILEASKYDQYLSVHLAGVSDLIAAEGKYHNPCYMQFLRKTSKSKESSENTDLAMEWLLDELKVSATRANVHQLSEVWKRYCDLAESAKIAIHPSYISRRCTFKEKLEERLQKVYELITLKERETLLLPVEYGHIPLSTLLSEEQEPSLIPKYKAPDGFMEMIHVALRLRGDILAHPMYTGFDVSEEEMISCVPDNLFMFLRLLFGGQSLLEADPEDLNDDKRQDIIQTKILSIGQDLVYNVTGGKHWTPKHIGLASTLHQATRSKELVKLFHNAGHIISYPNLLQVDTSLAESTLKAMDPDTGAVIPPNFVKDRFVHFTCDNIDINDSSFDGKNSFHATQVAGWQRGPEADMGLKDLRPSKKTSLEVPEIMEQIFPSEVMTGRVEPRSTADLNKEWYNESSGKYSSACQAMAKDMTFFIKRQDADDKKGWTNFNQTHQNVNQEVTSVGYMPIIQAPAHELDTLNTVVQRCKHIATSLGQHYVVLTVDEALYCKLMELKWAKDDYQDFLIVRLGGLHTSLTFLKVIGKHIQSAGLLDAWVESKILGPGTAEQIILGKGKSYSKAIRAHKLTIQAMWRILMPKLLSFIQNESQEIMDDIKAKSDANDIKELLSLFTTSEFADLMAAFVTSNENPNFKFWWSYMQMVEILLMFTRAQREGNWSLHLHSFQRMIPYFMTYDHTNYARWGIIYVNEMHHLPPEVRKEFEDGNFVVKRTTQKFNQVDPDQSQEWLNGIGKKRGGIIGITKTSSALSRWALSYNLRSHLANKTRGVYHLDSYDEYSHNESGKGRQTQDNHDEDNLLTTLKSFKLFSDEACDDLQNMATKDIVTKDIENDLLSAQSKGQEEVNNFIIKRLIAPEPRNIKFRDPLSKNKSLTFASLFEVKQKDSKQKGIEKAIKADRKIIQRLITAYESGRRVDLSSILTHELLTVPYALAETNRTLRTGSKADLYEVLTAGIPCPSNIDATDLGEAATLIIDGQAIVHSIAKPQKAVTFGDLADVFVGVVLQSGKQFKRIDVVFDRYYKKSIKSGTRTRRGQGSAAIRRLIESRDVPLPSKWDNFMAHPENKTDLANFLSQQMMLKAPNNKTIVLSGGFNDEEKVESSSLEVDTDSLKACHEEADTRIILHCMNNQASSIVIASRDTDVLVLLLAHFHEMPTTRVWQKAGTAAMRKYIPIHTIADRLAFNNSTMKDITAFHAITGSDTTSYLFRHGKKTCWKVFQEYSHLLTGLGQGELDEETAKDVELFICKVYNVPNASTVNKARAILFAKSCATDSLPPTSDALSFHIKRAHYQTSVWRQANKQYPELPPPETMGWRLEGTLLVPVLMSLPPVPDSCIELISCNCITRCMSARCKCKRTNLRCTAACKCRTTDDVCSNS